MVDISLLLHLLYRIRGEKHLDLYSSLQFVQFMCLGLALARSGELVISMGWGAVGSCGEQWGMVAIVGNS